MLIFADKQILLLMNTHINQHEQDLLEMLMEKYKMDRVEKQLLYKLTDKFMKIRYQSQAPHGLKKEVRKLIETFANS